MIKRSIIYPIIWITRNEECIIFCRTSFIIQYCFNRISRDLHPCKWRHRCVHLREWSHYHIHSIRLHIHNSIHTIIILYPKFWFNFPQYFFNFIFRNQLSSCGYQFFRLWHQFFYIIIIIREISPLISPIISKII